jgi:hypothetical protein
MDSGQLPLFEPVSPPANGKATQAELYRALHNMDVAYTQRFNVILEAINDGRDETQQLRTDFENFRNGGSGGNNSISIRLSFKKAAITAGVLVPLAAIATALAAIFGGG